MKFQNPDNFNPEKVLLREKTLTLASWPNKAKSDHHPSFIYSWFIKLLFLSHSNPKSCAVAYFEPKTYVLKPKLVFFSLLHVNLYQKKINICCAHDSMKSFPQKWDTLDYSDYPNGPNSKSSQMWLIDHLYIKLGSPQLF